MDSLQLTDLTLFTELTNSEATSIIGGAARAYTYGYVVARGKNSARASNEAYTLSRSFPGDNSASSEINSISRSS